MSFWARARERSVRELTRLACLLALAGLAVMAYSVVVPRPLPVILAMSLGQLVGVAAVATYVLAVVLDAGGRSSTAPNAASPPPPENAK